MGGGIYCSVPQLISLRMLENIQFLDKQEVYKTGLVEDTFMG